MRTPGDFGQAARRVPAGENGIPFSPASPPNARPALRGADDSTEYRLAGHQSPKQIPTERAAETISLCGSTRCKRLTACSMGTEPT